MPEAQVLTTDITNLISGANLARGEANQLKNQVQAIVAAIALLLSWRSEAGLDATLELEPHSKTGVERTSISVRLQEVGIGGTWRVAYLGILIPRNPQMLY